MDESPAMKDISHARRALNLAALKLRPQTKSQLQVMQGRFSVLAHMGPNRHCA